MRRAIEYWERPPSSWLTGVRVGEPYVPQEAHQRFRIEAWLFWGQQIPIPPIGSKSICYKLGLPARQTAKVVVCT